MLSRISFYEFWWSLLAMACIRINDASMLVTIMIRRFLYYNCPSIFKPISSMEENSKTLKVKNKYRIRLNMVATMIIRFGSYFCTFFGSPNQV